MIIDGIRSHTDMDGKMEIKNAVGGRSSQRHTWSSSTKLTYVGPSFHALLRWRD